MKVLERKNYGSFDTKRLKSICDYLKDSVARILVTCADSRELRAATHENLSQSVGASSSRNGIEGVQKSTEGAGLIQIIGRSSENRDAASLRICHRFAQQAGFPDTAHAFYNGDLLLASNNAIDERAQKLQFLTATEKT